MHGERWACLGQLFPGSYVWGERSLWMLGPECPAWYKYVRWGETNPIKGGLTAKCVLESPEGRSSLYYRPRFVLVRTAIVGPLCVLCNVGRILLSMIDQGDMKSLGFQKLNGAPKLTRQITVLCTSGPYRYSFPPVFKLHSAEHFSNVFLRTLTRQKECWMNVDQRFRRKLLKGIIQLSINPPGSREWALRNRMYDVTYSL